MHPILNATFRAVHVATMASFEYVYLFRDQIRCIGTISSTPFIPSMKSYLNLDHPAFGSTWGGGAILECQEAGLVKIPDSCDNTNHLDVMEIETFHMNPYELPPALFEQLGKLGYGSLAPIVKIQHLQGNSNR
jgi:hypothetical protein